MKKILIAMALLLLVGVVYAGDEIDYIKLEIENIATNGATASSYTYPNKVRGYVEGILVDVAEYATGTATVTVVTGSTGTVGVARTLLSLTLSSDTYYPVRLPSTTTAGAASADNGTAPIPLIQDWVSMTAVEASATMTTNTVTIWLFLRK